MVKAAQRVELTVDGIVAGGDGISRLETGRVIFLPRTAPGDQVLAELTESRARWARGRVVELLSAGPGRVAAPCAYYETCGGCHLQHIDVDTQLRALERGVADALTRIAKRDVTVRRIEPASRRLGYRNRVTFTLRRHGGSVVAGYHPLRGQELLDIEACPLAEPAVGHAWSELRAGWGKRAARLPRGREMRLTLRATAAGEVGLLVRGGDGKGDPDALVGAAPSIGSYWWEPSTGGRRHLAGAPRLRDTWDGREVHLAAGAFSQVNREVASAIEEHLDAELGDVVGHRILDLYAGIGLRGARWASAGADVVAVECDPDAVETARELAREAEARFQVRADRVENILDDLLPADVVVVNPPRSGLDAAVAERLAGGDAERLVYVSCDPGTLARDVRRLGDAWTPRFAQPFDAFPQTGHVETVLWLDRGQAA